MKKTPPPVATLKAIDEILASGPSSRELWAALIRPDVVEISTYILGLKELSGEQKTCLSFILGVMVLSFRKSGRTVRPIKRDELEHMQDWASDEDGVLTQEAFFESHEPHIWRTFNSMVSDALDTEDWQDGELTVFRTAFAVCLAAMIDATHEENEYRLFGDGLRRGARRA